MSLVYDPARRKVLRHGGVYNGDVVYTNTATMEWDGQVWTNIATGTFVRAAQAAIYDSVRGKPLIFGGSSVAQYFFKRDTWEFDGAQWNLIGTNGPPGRSLHAFVFDTHRSVGVLFGGSSADGNAGSYLGDTWEWDGAQWTQQGVQGPGLRWIHQALAYDPKRRKAVLFGGSAGGTTMNDTWEYGLEPLRITALNRDTNGAVVINWTGEAPPYQLQSRSNLSEGTWQNVGAPTDQLSATVPGDSPSRFFRVLSQ
jgi:hypothetical protein